MASVTIDSKIKIKLSPELKDIASELFEDENIETVDTIQLKKLREHLRSTPGQFHDLVTKCEMILPKPELAPRNPVLEARIQNLKAKQAQKEYDKMTDNVDPLRKIRIIEREDKPFSEQSKLINFKKYFILLCIYVDCTYILKPLIFFSSRFESIYCSHFSICHFNCIVIRFWIFGTILFVWNNVCRTQTSLWHYFSLCCGYG